MTSEARDESRESGQPIYLYRFDRQAVSWRYTSADRDTTHGGNDYAAAAITHGSIRSGGDSSNERLDLVLPRTLPVAAIWFPYAPADEVMVTILKTHAGETDAQLIWTGRVIHPKWTDTTLTVSSEPMITLTRSAASSPRLQRSCWKTCYSQGPGLCNADPEAHRVAGTVAGVDGFTLTIAAAAGFPDGRLVNGVVEWTDALGIAEVRTIVAHAGTQVTVDYGAASLADGLDVTLLPGCRQSWDDCHTYFRNSVNCGALADIPQRNPHDGNPVR